MPVKFRNQDFKVIKTKMAAMGKLFCDEEFPANTKSLYYSKVDNTIEWKRPKELCQVPKLISEDLSVDDLNIGELKNHWFVTACCSLTLQKIVWKKVIVNYKEQEFEGPKIKYAGIFNFHFWRYGKWVSVVVDDRLPTRDGKLIFVHSSDKNEFWSALLEKAYAKLYGDYESLSNGQAVEALVDFTGGVAEHCELHTFDLADLPTYNRLFDKLADAYDNRALQICKIDCSDEELGQDAEEGLVLGQWYCLTAAKDVELTPELETAMEGIKNIKMVRIFNPWGTKEYSGPWSNKSIEWNHTEKANWEHMGLKFKQEGDFWMPYDNFLKLFTHLDLCHFVNTGFFSLKKSWCEHIFHSQWCVAGRNGGSDYESPIMLTNPQFAFDITGNVDRIMVSLQQVDVKGREAVHGPLNNIGFHIMKTEDNREYRVHVAGDRVFSSDYCEFRSIFGTIMLWRGRYVIVPSTFQAGHVGQFMLRVYTSNTANARELNEDCPSPSCCGPKLKMVTVIRVLNCANLGLPPGVLGTCDPKIVMRCEGHTVRSGYKKDTINPEFAVSATFYRAKPLEYIAIEIWSHRRMWDVFIAQATFCEEAPHTGKKYTLDLVGRNKEVKAKRPGTMNVWAKCSHDLSSL